MTSVATSVTHGCTKHGIAAGTVSASSWLHKARHCSGNCQCLIIGCTCHQSTGKLSCWRKWWTFQNAGVANRMSPSLHHKPLNFCTWLYNIENPSRLKNVHLVSLLYRDLPCTVVLSLPSEECTQGVWVNSCFLLFASTQGHMTKASLRSGDKHSPPGDVLYTVHRAKPHGSWADHFTVTASARIRGLQVPHIG